MNRSKAFWKHASTYFFRGFLAIIPLYLSYLAVKFTYILVDKPFSELVEKFTGHRVYFLGVIFVVVLLYFIGWLTSNVIGKQFFNLIENLTSRIPIIKTIYRIGKQVSTALALPERQVFQQVVLVSCFRENVWSVAFVTGSVIDKKTNERFLKVFVPTTPTPASGFLVLAKESDTIDPNWTLEEGLKIVVSGGIIGPEQMREIKNKLEKNA